MQEDSMSHHHHKNHSALTDEEKLTKLLDHWVKHNNDHAQTYLEWASKIKGKNMKNVVSILEQAADLTNQINKKFNEASKFMK